MTPRTRRVCDTALTALCIVACGAVVVMAVVVLVTLRSITP